jgi:Na+/H+-translocating membrane pyrophosphatase
MDLEFLAKLAPTVASALGGPLAGMATELLASKLGVHPDDAQKMLEAGKLTADQVSSIQQAEIELKAKAQEMGLDFEKLATDDRKSARDMQTATRSWIPSVLAIGVTIGFFGILAGLMTGKVVAGPEIEIMLGSLGTAWTGIIAFYFGSSASSQKKDDLLHQSTPVNQ